MSFDSDFGFLAGHLSISVHSRADTYGTAERINACKCPERVVCNAIIKVSNECTYNHVHGIDDECKGIYVVCVSQVAFCAARRKTISLFVWGLKTL